MLVGGTLGVVPIGPLRAELPSYVEQIITASRPGVNYARIPLSGFSAPMQRLLEGIVGGLFAEKVLTKITRGHDGDYWPVGVEWSGDRNSIRILTPRGRYQIFLNRNVDPRELGTKVARLRTVGRDAQNRRPRLEGAAFLHPSWLDPEKLRDTAHVKKLLGLVRTLFRGDEYLHPHILSPDHIGPRYLSFFQSELNDRFKRARLRHTQDKNAKGPFYAGNITPGGGGKTIMIGDYLHDTVVRPATDGDFLIVMTVQDTDILAGVVGKVQHQLGLKPHEVLRKFGNGANYPIQPEHKLVVVTRSSFETYRDDFFRTMKKRKRIAVVVDEAHHIGTKDGEYRGIVEDLRKMLDRDQQILLMSATLRHPDADIITEVGENLVVAFLNEDEITQIKENPELLPALEVEQLRRGMLEGYVLPLHFIDLSVPNSRLPTRVTSALGERLRDGSGREVTVIPDKLVDELIYRSHEARVNPYLYNRMLVFTRGIAGCNELARLYQIGIDEADSLRDPPEQTLARTYHSGEPITEDRMGSFPRAIPWLEDAEEFDNVQNWTAYKALFVDGKLNEGVDLICADTAALVRPYASNESLQLIQNVTRLDRLAPGLPNFTLIAWGKEIRRITGFDNLITNLIQDTPPIDQDDANAVEEAEKSEQADEEMNRRRSAARKPAQEGRVIIAREENLTFARTRVPGLVNEQGEPAADDEIDLEFDLAAAERARAAEAILGGPPTMSRHSLPTPKKRGDIEAAHKILRRVNPFSDAKNADGSDLAGLALNVLNVLDSLSPGTVEYDGLVKGQRAERLRYRYHHLLQRAHRIQWNLGQISPGGPLSEDSMLVQTAKEENQSWGREILAGWNPVIRLFLGHEAADTTVAQEVVVSLNIPVLSRDFTTPAVEKLVSMYKKFAEAQHWAFSVLHSELRRGREDREPHIIKARLRITGNKAFDLFRFETGLHTIILKEGSIFRSKEVSCIVQPYAQRDSALDSEEKRLSSVPVRKYDFGNKSLNITQMRTFKETWKGKADSKILMAPELLGEILVRQEALDSEAQLGNVLRQFKLDLNRETRGTCAAQIAVYVNGPRRY
jgi:hypothetical protein